MCEIHCLVFHLHHINDHRRAALESPILFALKSKSVNDELTARAWERDAAPEGPILFALKTQLVRSS